MEEYKLLTALQRKQCALADMVEEMKVDIFEEEKEDDEEEINPIRGICLMICGKT